MRLLRRARGASTSASAAPAPRAAGATLDQLATLIERNRTAPSAETEARLVTLRNRAFAELEATDGSLVEPAASVPGSDPGADGVPAVDAASLTAPVIRAALLEAGCLLVRGLVSAERAAELQTGIDRVFAGRDAHLEGAPNESTEPWYRPFEPDPAYAASVAIGRGFVGKGSGVWTADSPRLLFELLETYERASLRATITEYLGERPAISVNKGTLRRAAPKVGTEWWHQDGAFLGEGIRSINVWLSLSDCGVDAPGLEIVPHRLEGIVDKGTEGADFHWSVGDAVVDRVSGGQRAWPVFAPGDALLFDHLFLHRTGTTPEMTKTRYATETWFFAPSAYPDPQEQVPLVF